jgi:2',3'-cyclic-nucleotide 2'-phosphodiesterase (5'-nucleotidase family)
MLTKIRFATAAGALMALVTLTGVAFAASVTSDSPLGTAGVRKSEVSIGDLVADSMREAIGADIAFVSASELKEKDAQIPKGKISTEDATQYVAYTDDPIVQMNLTGKQIRQAIERSVLIYPKDNLGFLQVSGLKVSFNPDKPAESRVVSIKLGDRTLSDSDSYTVAMTSSMANGALGYWKIWTKDNIVRTTDATIPTAIDKFFSARTRINYSNLNRIAVE